MNYSNNPSHEWQANFLQSHLEEYTSGQKPNPLRRVSVKTLYPQTFNFTGFSKRANRPTPFQSGHYREASSDALFNYTHMLNKLGNKMHLKAALVRRSCLITQSS